MSTTDRIVTAHVGLLDADGAVIRARDWLADPGSRSPRARRRSTASRPSTRGRDGAPARRGRRASRRRAARTAGCRHPGRRLQRAVRLLTAQARGDPARHRRRSSIPRRSSTRSSSTRPTTASAAASARSRSVAEHYAVRLDGAHEASADAVAAGRVAQALAERFAPGCCRDRARSCTPGRSPGRARRPRASPSTSSGSDASTRRSASTAAGRSAEPATERVERRRLQRERPRRSGAFRAGCELTCSSRRSS